MDCSHKSFIWILIYINRQRTIIIMKIINTSSPTKRNCFASFLLLCLFGLTSGSAANSTVFSVVPTNTSAQVATTNARFNPPILPSAVDRNLIARRTKRDNNFGKKYGNYNHKYTEKSKCTKKTTPLNNGGSKVTKKCIHQFYFGNNDIKTANGSGRTKAPAIWSPSEAPSTLPSISPTSAPTSAPTFGPTTGPTSGPTTGPTPGPTTAPTFGPTSGPTATPTNTTILTSTLPNKAGGTKTSSSKTAIGALVGGVLGFVVLAAGAKAVETVWSRRESSDSSSVAEEQA
mmetsp:Transcript_37949/g.92004  ORF Transcript_37949/g.92004 Transcript_37949/m.92004 type:complete len:288 (-) Transcript_37949:44-907(-)